MSGIRKSDHPERRKIALMRRADTESGSTHNIGGVKKRAQRPKPSLPKTPWDDEAVSSTLPFAGAQVMESGWVDSVEDGIVWGRIVRDGHEWEFWCPLCLLTDAARVDLQPGSYVTIRNGELAVNSAIWTTHDMETADREARALSFLLQERGSK